MPSFVDDLWKYEKQAYGTCASTPTLLTPVGPGCEEFGGSDKPLMVLLGTGGEAGGVLGRITTRFDGFSEFRNTVSADSKDWSDRDLMSDVLSHESCHLVEGSGQGVHESPSFEVWG